MQNIFGEEINEEGLTLKNLERQKTVTETIYRSHEKVIQPYQVQEFLNSSRFALPKEKSIDSEIAAGWEAFLK